MCQSPSARIRVVSPCSFAASFTACGDRERPRVAQHVQRELHRAGAPGADGPRRTVRPVVQLVGGLEARVAAVCSATPAPPAAAERPEKTYDTVAVETPARSATMRSVGRRRAAPLAWPLPCPLPGPGPVESFVRGIRQPFVPENAMPWMNCFCRIMNVISIGSVASSAPAMSTG